jgi:hypothetical protein
LFASLCVFQCRFINISTCILLTAGLLSAVGSGGELPTAPDSLWLAGMSGLLSRCAPARATDVFSAMGRMPNCPPNCSQFIPHQPYLNTGAPAAQIMLLLPVLNTEVYAFPSAAATRSTGTAGLNFSVALIAISFALRGYRPISLAFAAIWRH